MWLKQAVRWIRKNWRGPPLQLSVDGHTCQLGSGEPRTTAVVHRPALLPQLLMSPSMVFGEAYTRGEIEVHGRLMDLLEGAYRSFADVDKGRLQRILEFVAPHGIERRRAIANAQHHYDLGNDFYRLVRVPQDPSSHRLRRGSC